jgi:hypothetical protein
MDEECNDPMCKFCGTASSVNDILNVADDDQCLNCEAETDIGIPLSELCLLSALEVMGIDIDIPVTGSVYKFTAPNGVCLDTKRFSNAVESFNAQLPTGNLQTYLSGIFSTASTTLSVAAKDALYVIMVSVIVFGFVLFAIICMILIANDVIGAGLGIGLLFVGLFVGAMTLVIVLAEISSLSTQLENDLFAQVGPTFDTLRCAFLAGVCCYPGAAACCCSNPGTCKNVQGSPCTDMPG